jgi:hypothetical protein
MRVLAKTLGNWEYFTFASGGYIMTMRPSAMGRLVVPTVIGAKNAAGSVRTKCPRTTPSPMAAKIQTVRYRSRKDIFCATDSVMVSGSAGETEKFAAGNCRRGAVAIGLDGQPGETRPVATEDRVLLRGVLQAGEVGGERCGGRADQRVDAPGAALLGYHQAVFAEIGQMAGDLRLRKSEHGLEVAHAQGLRREQPQQPQPGLVTEAVVEVDEGHGRRAAHQMIFGNANMM